MAVKSATCQKERQRERSQSNAKGKWTQLAQRVRAKAQGASSTASCNTSREHRRQIDSSRERILTGKVTVSS